ncbi:MAG TPA: hypothetical protein VGF73_06985 [Chthoniobacterales bacterium]|jgi:hypothetical protein
MKKLLTLSRESSRLARTAATLLLAFGLTTALWLATIPVARARLMSPREMIEAGLPPGVVLKTAGKPQFLTAVCAAVKNHRKESPAIARTAVAAHGEYAGDIVATVVRCAHGEQLDCHLTGTIVAAAVAAAPASAVAVEDAAMAVAPDCADAIEGESTHESDGKEVLDVPAEGPGNYGGPPPISQAPLPGAVGGGGGFNPQELRVQICDNGRQRGIRTTRVNHYLNAHPGSFIGTCQVTPAVSR